MNIAIDNQALAMQSFGGVSRYIIELARGLTDLGGVRITWVPNLRIVRRDENNLSHLPRCRFPNFRGFYKLNTSAANLMMGVLKPDAFHSSYYYPVRSRYGVVRGTMIHDLIEEEQSILGARNLQVRLFRKRKSIELSDVLFFNSRTTKANFDRFYPEFKGKRVLTYLGSDFSHSLGDNIARRAEILYVGKRNGYKNFKMLHSVFNETPVLYQNFRLVLFGGPRPTGDELASPGEVIYVNGGDFELRAAYMRASVFVFPSFDEGFGLPVVESLKLNTPVLCSSIDAFREIGRDNVFYFDQKSKLDLKDKLLWLAQHQFPRPFQSSQVQQEALSRFSWQECARITRDTYAELITEKRVEGHDILR